MCIGMNSEPANDPNRPVVYSTQPPDEWGAALIVACLALGFVSSWAVYEMHTRIADQVNAVTYRHDLDMLAGQQSDLGRLLADPRTKLVRLAPVDASISRISVAWNQESQTGAVFSENLADGGGHWYQLWLMPAAGRATIVSFGPTEPGRAVYPISSTQPADPPDEMILTPQNRTDAPHEALARGKVAQED
jgi:hypothetical protein